MNWLLRRMEVFPNAYYNYRKHRKNAYRKRIEKTLKIISSIYHTANGIPGYRAMRNMLKAKEIVLSVQTVRKYMNVELGLKSVTRKKKRYYASRSEAYAVFENLLNQHFVSEARNRKWCIDFTYIYFAGKKRYNCTIIDLYDRRVVASVNSNRIDTKLAIDTLEKAFKRSGSVTGVILHSDRGSQFTAKAFVKYCKQCGVKQSMSRPGNPYDNAPMERYFNTLKTELLYIHKYDTEERLYTSINSYAYGYYNNLRPHTYNGGLPPMKVA